MNLIELQNAIWTNPEKCFSRLGYSNFRQNANGVQLADLGGERGKIRLKRGENDSIIVFYNGASYHNSNVITFLLESGCYNGLTYIETAQEIAQLYGGELDNYRAKSMAYRDYLKPIAEIITNTIDTAVNGYLRNRGFDFADTYGANLRCFGALNETTAKQLETANIPANVLQQLHLTAADAAKGYRLVIFEYVRGRMVGLQVRDITGYQSQKYLCITGGAKFITSPVIDRTKPVYYVEGNLKAFALTKAGVKNVCALNGAGITESQKHELIHTTGAAVYVPDKEYNADGAEQPTAVNLEIKALKQFAMYYSPLFVWTLPPLCDANGNIIAGKVDADSFLNGGGKVSDIIQETAHKRFIRSCETCRTQRELLNEIDSYYKLLPPIEQTLFKSESVDVPDITDYLRRIDGETAKVSRIEATAKAIDYLNSKRITDAKNILATIDGRGVSVPSTAQLIEKAKQQPPIIELHNLPLMAGAVETCCKLRAGSITTFGALPSHGKTAILCHIAAECAKQNSKRVCYYSVEESPENILRRLCNIILTPPKSAPSKSANVDAFSYYSQNDTTAIETALNGITIPAVNSNEIDTFAAFVQEHSGEYDVYVIDYVGLFSSAAKSYSRTDELKAVALRLNAIAKAYEIAIVIGSQLNRELYYKPFETLSLKVLAESAEIERISSYVYLCYNVRNNDELTGNEPDFRRRILQNDSDELRTGLYIECAKNRFESHGVNANNVLPFDGGLIGAKGAKYAESEPEIDF